MSGFGWAGAAAGAQGAVDQQRKQALLQQQAASDLENALAERAYKQALIQNEQARQQQAAQQMQAQRDDAAKKQAAIEQAAQAAGDPLKAAAIRAGILTGQAILPEKPATPHQEWVNRAGTLVYGTPAQGDTPYEKPSVAQPHQEWLQRSGQLVYAAPQQGDRPYQAPSREREPVVKVETVENGQRVIKYLPQSQVVGKTFEDQAPKGRAPIGQERTALSFYNRAKQADDTVNGLEPMVTKQGMLGQLQMQYSGPGSNLIQSPQQQSYRQAQRAFTEARLRKESGAAIPTAEYENDARTYFAQPGDDENTIAQKRTARQAVLDALAFQAGPAFEEYYGQPFQKNAAGVNPAPVNTAHPPIQKFGATYVWDGSKYVRQ